MFTGFLTLRFSDAMNSENVLTREQVIKYTFYEKNIKIFLNEKFSTEEKKNLKYIVVTKI